MSGRAATIWLFAAAFATYAAFAAPGVDWLDAGELTAAGWSLGISHPPGQPGYAMLVKAASLLPFGEIAFRASLVSAFAAATAVAGTFALAAALSGAADRASRAGALAAAALAGASPLLVEQATRPEVYAPTLALVVWGLVATLRHLATDEARHARTATFVVALAATFHPLVSAAAALTLGAAIAARLAVQRTGLRIALSRGAALVLLGLLGLAVIAYLPIRAGAAHPPLLNWGHPDTPARLRDVLSARAYGQNFAAAGFARRVLGHALLLREGVGAALLPLGALGFVVAHRRRGALVLAMLALVITAAAASQRVFLADNPDVHGYLTPAVPALAAGLGALVATMWRRLPARLGVVALAPAVVLAILGPREHALGDGPRRKDDPLRYLDQTAWRTPAGPALFVAHSDHLLFPAWYERLVCGERPDVALGEDDLVKSSWFLAMLDRALPELFVPFVDDGRKDHLARRLIGVNLAAGRPVAGEQPFAPDVASRPLGLAFRYLSQPTTDTSPAEEPAVYEGELGRRIGRHAGLLRAEWERDHGRWLEAARAGGVIGRFSPTAQAALAHVPASMPVLARYLPAVTPVFLFAPFESEVLTRDLAFGAGLGPGDPPDATEPLEVRLLYAWHLMLGGDERAGLLVDNLGQAARDATARMVETVEPSPAPAGQRALPRIIEASPAPAGQRALPRVMEASPRSP